MAFAGDSGGGKSTTAAALHARGLDLVTDDLLVLDPDAAGGVVVYPGFPVLRLWPEAAAAVTLGEGAGVPPGSGSAKLAWPARPAAFRQIFTAYYRRVQQILETMQHVVDSDGPRDEVSVNSDAAALQVRRIVNRLIADERMT